MNEAENLSGRMRQRIILQQKMLSADGGGGNTITWQDVATMWAEVVPLRSGEPFSNDKLGLKNVYRVTIRYRSDVNADRRFIFGSKTLEINGIIDVDQRKQTLEITASEDI